MPSIYEICKPEYVSAFKFSKAVKIDQKVFPIGLVVEGCGAVPEKTSISVDDPKVVSMKKNMGWENKKYDQQTAHQLNTSNKSYLLFEGIYFKEDKKDKFKNLTLADVAVFEPSSNNILIKDESLTCCDPSQFGDCAYKRFAIKMCMPLSANLEIEGLFNSKSQLKGYSIGGISEGAHVFTWKFENENRKESYHNYAYAVGGCE